MDVLDDTKTHTILNSEQRFMKDEGLPPLTPQRFRISQNPLGSNNNSRSSSSALAIGQ